MARSHVYPAAERARWVAWYTAEHGRTVQATADHFGVPVSQVRREMQRQRDRQRGREGSASEYQYDPYGAAMSHIAKAIERGLANEGAMSQYEYDTLCALRDVLANRDPASLG